MNDTSNDAEYNQRAMRAIVLCVLVAIVYTIAKKIDCFFVSIRK